MTYLEKAHRCYPGMSRVEILRLCPEDLGFESVSPCGSMPELFSTKTENDCGRCWNREADDG